MSSKDREIGRAWNRFNINFRIGYLTATRGEPNPGKPNGTPAEKGQDKGWQWKTDGKELPTDPLWTVLDADRLFKP